MLIVPATLLGLGGFLAMMFALERWVEQAPAATRAHQAAAAAGAAPRRERGGNGALTPTPAWELTSGVVTGEMTTSAPGSTRRDPAPDLPTPALPQTSPAMEG